MSLARLPHVPDAISPDQLAVAADALGLNPNHLREVIICPNEVQAEVFLMDPEREGLILSGSHYVTANVTIPVERKATP